MLACTLNHQFESLLVSDHNDMSLLF